MRLRGKTFLQCQSCGEIFEYPRIVRIDTLYLQAHCQNCGMATALNLGSKEEDIAIYMNSNIDPRFFDYSTKLMDNEEGNYGI